MLSTFVRCLSLAVLGIATLNGAVQGQTGFAPGLTKDYLIPPVQVSTPAISTLKTPVGKGLGPGVRESYTAFSGKTHQLTRFHGLYVDVLFPDTWMQGLSAEKRQRFIDLADLVYQHLLEMVGTPPAGDGPLQIAVVPDDVCDGALGCGFVGRKGLEMLDDSFITPFSWRQIDLDVPSGIVIHEMTHNFDVFSTYIGYTPDSAHAWTDFMSYYFFPYSRQGYEDGTPGEVTKDWLATTAAYFHDPKANWEDCVRDDRCEDRLVFPDLTWGGFAFRLGLLDGPQAVKRFTAFLAQYKQTHEAPETAEAKNDLFIEALAAGAQHNLGCVVDTWHWHVSDAARGRMRRLYGNRNPDCQDLDHDGFSPLQEDCNDHRATVHPGAPERTRHVDDDCDGRVDEALLRGPVGGDLSVPRRITLPMEINASPQPQNQGQDIYSFHLGSPGRVYFELCTPPDEYATLVFDGSDASLRDYFGGCVRQAFPLEAGDWRFAVLTAPTTHYSVSVQAAEPWPAPPWALTAPPRPDGNRFVLAAPPALPHLAGPGAQVRFWVSGQGLVGTVPYSPGASIAWTPLAGVDPLAEGLFYRAQLLVGGAPVYEITPPQPF
jgi:hypothetical protein